MEAALQGLVVGLVTGIALLVFEYVMINRSVADRAKKYNRKREFDVTDRRRMQALARFAAVLPFAFALMFWIVSFAQ